MKICAIADTHGHLPNIPACDILLIAGDICPTFDHSTSFQELWIRDNFYPWVKNTPATHAILVAGNHDFIFEKERERSKTIFQWHTMYHSEKKPLGVDYLQDSFVIRYGLKIWGSPWQLPFGNWAFNAPEKQIEHILQQMPNDVDIIVSHGPPYGYGDFVPHNNLTGAGESTGSRSLLKKIQEIKPKLCVFGHIHEGRGEWQLGKTKLANVTMVDSYYRRKYQPWVYEL